MRLSYTVWVRVGFGVIVGGRVVMLVVDVPCVEAVRDSVALSKRWVTVVGTELDRVSVAGLNVLVAVSVKENREMLRIAERESVARRDRDFSPLYVIVRPAPDAVTDRVEESSGKCSGRVSVMVSDLEKFMVRNGVH